MTFAKSAALFVLNLKENDKLSPKFFNRTKLLKSFFEFKVLK